MKLRIAQFITIILLILVAGVFWGTWFSIARSITTIDAQTFLAIGRITIGNLALPMSILIPITSLSTLLVLFLLYRQKSMLAFYLMLCGLVLFIVATAITLLVNVPIDNQIKQWTVQTLPSDWQTIRDRWEFYHTIRTFVSLSGLALIIAAALLPSKIGADDVKS
jgi:uncharacterized membrane protein